MKPSLWTLAVLTASLLLIAGAVFVGDDRATFVPAPDAAAEGFARQIATRRYDLAMNYLASPAVRVETPERLASRFGALFSSAGKINKVEAEPQWMDQKRAAVRATIAGDSGEASFELGFIRENGLWRIDQLPDLVR